MRRNPLLLAVGAVVLWSVQDILIWRYWLGDGRWLQFDGAYQFWHYAFLIALMVTGALWLKGWRGAIFALATWTLANSGLADALYYWLSLRPIPGTLPWLDTVHPLIWGRPVTAQTLVGSAMIWLAVWMALSLPGTLKEAKTP